MYELISKKGGSIYFGPYGECTKMADQFGLGYEFIRNY